ncbi:MAG TPA: DUF3618 domain-containing protein, partial [Rhodoblastus sp.]|nr:DUF3618 domain-containing protein [Rhodoblastus sp.]
MVQTDTRSVEQIRRDAERARANLTDTVHQLRATVSDAAGDVRQRFSAESIRDELVDAARRNPLQTAAVGALVAWPVMRLVRAIPLPVLMIGAGLFLTGSKSGQDLSRKAVDRAADVAGDLRERAHGLTDAAKESAGRLSDQAAQLADDLRGKVQDAAEKAAAVTSEASARATAFVSELTPPSGVGGLDPASIAAATRDGVDTAREAVRSAQRGALSTAEDVLAWAKANPLLVTGLAVAAGGFIASALPPTAAERSVAGKVSGAVRSAARQGVNAAVGSAALAAVDMARRAAKEGFDPDRLERAARDYGERTTKAADAAAAAMGEPPVDARK